MVLIKKIEILISNHKFRVEIEEECLNIYDLDDDAIQGSVLRSILYANLREIINLWMTTLSSKVIQTSMIW
jgi:hypothetical protein